MGGRPTEADTPDSPPLAGDRGKRRVLQRELPQDGCEVLRAGEHPHVAAE